MGPRTLSTAIVNRARFYSARKKKPLRNTLQFHTFKARLPCHARAGEGFGNGTTARIGMDGYNAQENSTTFVVCGKGFARSRCPVRKLLSSAGG